VASLSDIVPEVPAGLTVRRARVISISGRSLTVDMGGPIVVQSLGACYPRPDQFVYMIGEGSSFTAIGVVNDVPRQATITVTADATNVVTGLVNGISVPITKMGAYTAAVGDTLPLIWAADGSGVWAGAKPGAAYVPPPSGGGSGGSPGGVTSGTSTYAPTYSGSYIAAQWWPGSVGGFFAGFFYGAGRFRELQGRTIRGFRANLTRQNGSGSIPVYGNPQSGPSGVPSKDYSAGSVNPSGWTNLPIGLASYLIGGSGTGAIILEPGQGTLNGAPYGALQFDWSR